MELGWLIKVILLIVGIAIIIILGMNWFSSETNIFNTTINNSVNQIININPLIFLLSRSKKAVAFHILVLVILAIVSLAVAIYFYYSWAGKVSNPVENLINYTNSSSSRINDIFDQE